MGTTAYTEGRCGRLTSSPLSPLPLKMKGLTMPGSPDVFISTDIFTGACQAWRDAMTIPPVWA